MSDESRQIHFRVWVRVVGSNVPVTLKVRFSQLIYVYPNRNGEGLYRNIIYYLYSYEGFLLNLTLPRGHLFSLGLFKDLFTKLPLPTDSFVLSPSTTHLTCTDPNVGFSLDWVVVSVSLRVLNLHDPRYLPPFPYTPTFPPRINLQIFTLSI